MAHGYMVFVAGVALPAVTFDERPLKEMLKVWLDTWKRESADMRRRYAEHEKAHMVNERTKKNFLERQDYEEEPTRVDIAVAPAITPELEDLVFFNGIPEEDGYGSFACLATHIMAIGYADPKDLAGVRSRIEDARPRS